jgi:hypothetical protein
MLRKRAEASGKGRTPVSPLPTPRYIQKKVPAETLPILKEALVEIALGWAPMSI